MRVSSDCRGPGCDSGTPHLSGWRELRYRSQLRPGSPLVPGGLTPLPTVPRLFAGLIVLRGELVAVVDLGAAVARHTYRSCHCHQARGAGRLVYGICSFGRSGGGTTGDPRANSGGCPAPLRALPVGARCEQRWSDYFGRGRVTGRPAPLCVIGGLHPAPWRGVGDEGKYTDLDRLCFSVDYSGHGYPVRLPEYGRIGPGGAGSGRFECRDHKAPGVADCTE